MKKYIPIIPLVFLLACHNNPAETNSSITNSSADSTSKWARNAVRPPASGDTINFTDGNNLKQGKWITVEKGNVTKTEFYKDGKLVDLAK